MKLSISKMNIALARLLRAQGYVRFSRRCTRVVLYEEGVWDPVAYVDLSPGLYQAFLDVTPDAPKPRS